MIQRLVNLIKSLEIEPEARDIADILWLAGHLAQENAEDIPNDSDQRNSKLPSPPKGIEQGTSTKNVPDETGNDFVSESAHAFTKPVPAKAKLSVPDSPLSEKSSDLQFGTPKAPGLNHKLAISRALRPLLKRVPARDRFVLDELATVEQVANTGQLIPVMRPDLINWLCLHVIIDESSSMVIWRQLIRDYINLLQNSGGFRQVIIWSLWTSQDGNRVELYHGYGNRAKLSARRSPRELIAADASSAAIILSDCVSPAWYNGQIANVISQWENNIQVALINVLPIDYWSRTGLALAPEVYLRARSAALPNSKFSIVRKLDPFSDINPNSVRLPVLSLDADVLESWARSMAGQNDAIVHGAMVAREIIRIENQEAVAGRDQPTAKDQLEYYRSTATPSAWNLARYLSSMRRLSLPVMHLVHAVLLPNSGPEHLAEFYLSGLIRRVNDSKASPKKDIEIIRYEFANEEILNQLSGTLTRSEFWQIFNLVSDYIGRRLHKSSHFLALLSGSLSDWAHFFKSEGTVFAEINTNCLRELGGQYAALADELDGTQEVRFNSKIPTDEKIPKAKDDQLPEKEDTSSHGIYAKNWLSAWQRATEVFDHKGGFSDLERRQVEILAESFCAVLGFDLGEHIETDSICAWQVEASITGLNLPSYFPLVFIAEPNPNSETNLQLLDVIKRLPLKYDLCVIIPLEPKASTTNISQELRRIIDPSFKRPNFIVLSQNNVLDILQSPEPDLVLEHYLTNHIPSPFIVHGPVPEKMFFGRGNEIRNLIESVGKRNFAVTGNRMIGKTSLLLRVRDILEQSSKVRPLRVDCQTVRELKDFYSVFQSQTEIQLNSPTLDSLRGALQSVISKSDMPIVLILEEVDTLLASDNTEVYALLAVFRMLAQSQNSCSFIFSGGRVLSQKLRDPQSVLYNFLQRLILGNLHREEMDRLIIEPLTFIDIQVPDRDAILDAIWWLTSGHPNLTQYVGNFLVEAVNKSHERFVSFNDVENLRSNEKFIQHYFRVIWGNASPLEKLISLLMPASDFSLDDVQKALENTGISATKMDVISAVEMLVVLSILARRGQFYYFAPHAFHELLDLNYEKESLINLEIANLTEMVNVFQFRGSLPSYSPLFKGRQSDLNKLVRWCQGEVHHYGIVLGAPKSGVSSLLLRLEQQLSSTHLVYHANFSSHADAQDGKVFNLLAHGLSRAFSQPLPTTEVVDANQFTDFVYQLLEASPDRNLILLVEGLSTLPLQTRLALANALRFIFTNRYHPTRKIARFMVILAGNTDIYDLTQTEVSPLANICETHYLGDLSELESIELIQEGLSKLTVPKKQSAKLGYGVYKLAHGYPYLTQRLGHALEIAHENGKHLNDELLEQTVLELIKQDDPLLSQMQKVLLELDLMGVAQSVLDKKIRFSRQDDQMVRLELLGLIRSKNGYWQIRNQIFIRALQSWISKTSPALDNSSLCAQLIIEEINLRFSIQLVDQAITLGGFSVGMSEKAKIQVDDILNDLETGAPAICQRMFNLYLPFDIQEAIKAMEPSVPLQIITNYQDQPWELMHDGQDFLCLKFQVGRKLPLGQKNRKHDHLRGKLPRFLLIANPSGDLPMAEKEIYAIQESLKGDAEFVVLTGKNATRREVIDCLINNTPSFDVIHYAGHARLSTQNPEESCLVLHDGFLSADEIKLAIQYFPMVFLNIGSASFQSSSNGLVNYMSADTAGLLTSFLLGGARACIGSLWNVNDGGDLSFVINFYKHLIRRASLGEALRKARLLSRAEQKSKAWASYVLYGDPTDRLL